MGVTYKLKQEILEFIVQQKQESVMLSCRKLADLVQDRFGVDVSKSSINAVLKNSRLSSPVGRHPKSVPLKNFFIPREKKDALLSQVRPFLTSQIQGGLDSVEETKTEASCEAETVTSDISEAVNIPDCGESEEDPTLDLPLPPDTISGVVEKPEISVSPVSESRNIPLPVFWGLEDDGPILDKAGIVFLAGFWLYMAPDDRIGEILVRALSSRKSDVLEHASDRPSPEALEILVLLKGLGIHRADQLTATDLRALVRVMTGTEVDMVRPLADLAEILSKESRILWEIESELSGYMTDITFFELTRQSGGKIFLSGDMKQHFPSPCYEERLAVPLYRAQMIAADRWLNNVRPVLVWFSPSQNPFGDEMRGLWQAASGRTEDPFEKLAAVSVEGRNFPVIDRMPRLRRSVIFAGPATEQGMALLETEKIGEGGRYQCPLTGAEWKYGTFTGMMGDDNVKIILINNLFPGLQTMIVTNAHEHGFSDTQIVAEVLGGQTTGMGMAPKLQSTPLDSVIRIRYAYDTPFQGSFWSCFDYIVGLMARHRLVSEKISGWQKIQSKLVDIPGKVKFTNFGTLVRLYPSADYPYLSLLQEAVRAFNLLRIGNRRGGTIFLSIENNT